MNLIHIVPYFSLRFVLILFYILCLGLQSYPTHWGFQTNFVCIFMSVMPATRPAYPTLLYLITVIIIRVYWGYKLWSSSLGSLPQLRATSCLLGPNILFSFVFSDNFKLCYVCNIGWTLLNTRKGASTIIILYVLIFVSRKDAGWLKILN